MKYLIATDIHGNKKSAQIIKEKFEQLGADKIILLGDLLYNGPRNPVEEDYSPKDVIEILNSLSDKIIAVKGNCDGEVDQMVLNFMLNDCAVIELNGKTYFCTHGHHINQASPAKIAKGAVVLYGHFHKTEVTNVDDVTYLNIASITFPKNNNVKCYGVLDENGVCVYSLRDELILKV